MKTINNLDYMFSFRISKNYMKQWEKNETINLIFKITQFV